VKLRRFLFAALLAVCYDVAVPLEPSAHGGLVWEDDEEEAVRADKKRVTPGAAHRAPAPRPAAVVARTLLATRRMARPRRRPRVRRLAHVTAPPPRPAPTEDH
jgi:hypothetical protein